MSIAGVKTALRGKMKSVLAGLSQESITMQSSYIINKLVNMPEYVQSQRIAVYLSMPEEVQTDELVKNLIESGKECFIPVYDPIRMVMVKLRSLEDFLNLPKNKWNIRQPKDMKIREDAYKNGGLDLVITPGLAFTLNGKRLGRGKGYYDRYLSEMKSFREQSGKQLITIGMGFSQQIVDDIPVMDYDFELNKVLYYDKDDL